MTVIKNVAFLLFFIAFPVLLPAHEHCNHRHGFSRSPVADSVDAIHYTIHISQIDFTARTIRASAEVLLRPHLITDRIPLELKNLSVDSVKINNQLTAFQRHGEIVRVMSPVLLYPTDTVMVKVYYGGAPFHEQWGGFHFSGNYAFNLGVGFVSDPHNLGKAWFPCVDDFQDRATYEVLVTLPQNMKGIAGGLLTNVIHHDNGTKTWHWKLDQPIPTYLASVAAGEYALTGSDYQGQAANIPITIYTRPADTLKVGGSFLNLQQILQHFEARFGPYPFGRVGYTGTAIGAMEHVTNIAYPHSAINGNLSSEYLLAHELSHMWFGNLVTCADASDMWLNEGWATFCHHFFRNDIYGPTAYRNVMRQTHYDVIKNVHISDGTYFALNNVPGSHTYGKTVYDKGATVVHTLMNYMGEAAFFDAVRAYLQAFAFRHASSFDMRDFFSTHSGINLNGFFDAWVFSPGTPHYSIDSVHTLPAGNQFTTELYLRYKHKGYQHIGQDNIVEVSFLKPNWQIQSDTVHFNGSSGKSTKTLDFEPLMTMMDFYDKTADATTDFNGIIRTTGQNNFSQINFTLFVDALPDSAFYRFTHHWVAPDSLKTATPGLRISPYRYWEFNGLFPLGKQMRGRFFYSNTNNLDGSLIRSSKDSVVLMFRPSAAFDWVEIPSTRTGLWSVGYLMTENFQPGQYALAAWDTQITANFELTAPNNTLRMRAEPNPTRHELRLSWDIPITATITITDTSGKQMAQKKIQQSDRANFDQHNWPSGVYIADLLSHDGKKQGFVKFIVAP